MVHHGAPRRIDSTRGLPTFAPAGLTAVACDGSNLRSLNMSDDDKLVTYTQLESEFGIQISRTHIARLEKTEKFPKRFKPFRTRGSRFYYRRREIRAWLQGMWP